MDNTITVTIKGIEIHGLHWGNPNGEPVLALHGWLDNAASFEPLITHLPQFNWTAIDLPGHGHSFHRPAHSHYHFIDWISDLRDLIVARYQNKPVVIVGHSLGGLLATVLAGVYPELVKQLVLIDSAGLVTGEMTSSVMDLRKALDSRITKKSQRTKYHKSFESALTARIMAGDLSKSAATLLVSRNIRQCENGFSWRTDSRLRTLSPVRLNTVQAQSIISAITAPTLICLAQSGSEQIKQGYQVYKSYYQNLKTTTISGGHHCHMDYPEETAEAIHSFCSFDR